MNRLTELLAASRGGRCILHVVAAVCDHAWGWHWAGIAREIGGATTTAERTEAFSLLDPRFRYVTSLDTNLAEKFQEVFALNALRRQQKEEKFRRIQLD